MSAECKKVDCLNSLVVNIKLCLGIVPSRVLLCMYPRMN